MFDWKNTARLNIRKLADQKGESVNDEAFANDWRAEMFKIHTQVRNENYFNETQMESNLICGRVCGIHVFTLN